MDRHELNRMFDGLTPDPRREQELLKKLLQDDARRKTSMKNWKRVFVAVAAAALMVTAATAAVWSGMNQRLLDYLGVDPQDSEAVAEAENLLLPGAMAVDITKESNGATLHVTQVLRDRYKVMILADFTAPEGAQLYLGESNPTGVSTAKGFNNGAAFAADFLDKAGNPLGKDGLVSFYNWEVLEDDDSQDNRVSLMFTLAPQQGENAVWDAACLRVPAVDLAYYDLEQGSMVTVYSGDWSFETPLPQQDIGWTIQMDQVIGELDGSTITAKELYLSPMTIGFVLEREGGFDFGAPVDEENEAAYSRWLSIGNAQQLTLTTKDGELAALEPFGGGGIGFEEKLTIHRLSQVTDPAKFQGGTLAIEWDFTHNSEEAGSTTILLDGLLPVDSALSAD